MANKKDLVVQTCHRLRLKLKRGAKRLFGAAYVWRFGRYLARDVSHALTKYFKRGKIAAWVRSFIKGDHYKILARRTASA